MLFLSKYKLVLIEIFYKKLLLNEGNLLVTSVMGQPELDKNIFANNLLQHYGANIQDVNKKKKYPINNIKY